MRIIYGRPHPATVPSGHPVTVVGSSHFRGGIILTQRTVMRAGPGYVAYEWPERLASKTWVAARAIHGVTITVGD